MHEVALSRQLVQVVARASAGQKVTRVYLTIGALRQVVPTSLEYAWQFVTEQTPLRGAQLSIDWLDAVICCPHQHQHRLDPQEYLSLLCPECGEVGTVIQGEEFRVDAVDVEKQNPA